MQKTILVGVGGLAALATSGLVLVGSAGTSNAASGSTSGAFAATAAPDTTSCNGVLSGAGAGPLEKALVSVSEVSSGTYSFTFQVTSPRAAGTYRLRDCVYIDSGAPGYQDEPVIAGTDDKDVAFTTGPNGQTATFTVTVSDIGPGKLVCDRASISGSAAGTGFTDKSNEVCLDPASPPPVPEAPLALVLPLAILGTAGVVWSIARSRRPVGVAPATG